MLFWYFSQKTRSPSVMRAHSQNEQDARGSRSAGSFFFTFLPSFFLHCSTVPCIRQVVKYKNNAVSAVPATPPTALQIMAGKTRMFSSDAKDAVWSCTERPEKMTAKAVRGKPPGRAASVWQAVPTSKKAEMTGKSRSGQNVRITASNPEKKAM